MTRSTPSISSLGKMLPQSTTTMSSSYSKTVMFLPISSTPPRLTIRRRLAGCAAFVLGVIPSLSFKRFRSFSFTYFHRGSKKAIFAENCCWTRQACVSPNPSVFPCREKTHSLRCAFAAEKCPRRTALPVSAFADFPRRLPNAADSITAGRALQALHRRLPFLHSTIPTSPASSFRNGGV